MKWRMFTIVGAGTLAILAATSVAQAGEVVTAKIPMAFVAGQQTYAPGTYELSVSEDETTIELTPPKGTPEVLSVVTRLAGPAPFTPASEDCRVVFDKTGGTDYLTEVWLPGDDGYLLRATGATHTHTTVKASKTTK